VDGIDGRLVLGLKRQVHASRQFACGGRRLTRGDEQLVRPKKTGALATWRDLEHAEDCLVETFRLLQIGDDELEVIEQTPSMKFVGLHACQLERLAAMHSTKIATLALGTDSGVQPGQDATHRS
jgi:hypothetical protein